MSDVIVVGGGLAGLACAARLARARVAVTVLEATDCVGGRVRTDEVDGFLLDHGFQVLLTAYPACRELLDYDALSLQPFEPGAMIRTGGGWTMLGDPWRRPSQVLPTALSSAGSLADKWRVAKLRRRALSGTLEDVYQRPQQSAFDRLEELGFSDRMIDRFFRPFLGGVFLDPELETSSRMLEFVFRMLASGDAAVPAAGMQAIARQLADHLPAGAVRREQTVAEVATGRVRTTDGAEHNGRAIVVATEEPAAARLLGRPTEVTWQSTATVYFAAERAPLDQPMLMLDGGATGLVNHVAVMSNVAASYAPPGQALISASVVRPESNRMLELAEQVRDALRGWFGEEVDRWRHLRTYSIPFALPAQPVGRLEPVLKEVALGDGIFVCGDHRETSSIHGAMNSGLRAAEAALDFLKAG